MKYYLPLILCLSFAKDHTCIFSKFITKGVSSVAASKINPNSTAFISYMYFTKYELITTKVYFNAILYLNFILTT